MAKANKTVKFPQAEQETAASVAADPAAATDAAAPATITIQDLAFIVQIIDTVSRRGAFQGDELAVIGTYRNKVDSWVKQNTPPATEAAAPNTDAPKTDAV